MFVKDVDVDKAYLKDYGYNKHDSLCVLKTLDECEKQHQSCQSLV